MIDAAKIVLAAALLNHLGLPQAIIKKMRLKRGNYVINCSKCLAFWATIAWELWDGQTVLDATVTAAVAAYAALWTELLLAWTSQKYEKLWERLSHGPE